MGFQGKLKTMRSYGIYFTLGIFLENLLGWLKVNLISFQQIRQSWYDFAGLGSYFYSQLEPFYSLYHSLIEWLVKFQPNTSFLSDIIAFQSAVIAIAIPLSFEIISRISERYSSDVITRQFNREWSVNSLRYLLIINIVAVISLKFFLGNNSVEGYWKLASWLIFIVFIITTVILLIFFDVLKDYSTNTRFLLSKLYKDIDESLKVPSNNEQLKEKKVEYRQNKLIQAVEGIGDVLVFEAKNKKGNKWVIEGLDKIQNIINQLLAIKQVNLNLYEQLLLSTAFKQIAQQNPDPLFTAYALTFNSKESLITVTTIINQFQRINETATEAKNFELAYYPVRFLIYILQYLTKGEEKTAENKILVEEFLKIISDIRRFSLQHQDTSTAYSSSITWYKTVIFNALSQKISGRKFNINYLAVFDKYFWESLKFIISRDEQKVYEGIVKSLISGIDLTDDDQVFHQLDKASLFNSDEDHFKLSNCSEWKFIIKKLNHLGFYTEDELNKYRETYEQLKLLAFSTNQQQYLQELQTIEKDIFDIATDRFKYNNLQAIIFCMSAYCIFKRQYYYIKYLWNFNQPADSDATWLHRDITPSSLQGVVTFFFRSRILYRNFRFDDHHGSSIYLQKYFILLLIRELNKIPIFEIPTDHQTPFLLILNQKKIGHIIQYFSFKDNVQRDSSDFDYYLLAIAMLLNHQYCRLLYLHISILMKQHYEYKKSSNFLNIDVISLSENDEALNKFIEQRQAWLQQQPCLQQQGSKHMNKIIYTSCFLKLLQDKPFSFWCVIHLVARLRQKQRDYLKQQVLIKLTKRLRFVPHEDFEGYIINLKP